MDFNYFFDISAIFIFIIVILMYKQQNLVKNNAYYVFFFLWACALSTPITDIASIISLNYKRYFIFEIATMIYFLGQQWTAFFFSLYAVAPFSRKRNMFACAKKRTFIPILISSTVIILNPFLHWIYTVDWSTGEYTRGWAQIICYLICLSYYLNAMVFVIQKKEIYNKQARKAILFTIGILGVCVITQFLFPDMMTHSFGISLGLLQLLIVAINQNATMDPDTKMLNQNAFHEKVTSLIFNQIHFHTLVIRMADYPVILATYGYEITQKLIHEVCIGLQEMIPKHEGYQFQDDLICIIYENQTEKEKKATEKQIEQLLSRKWKIDHFEIEFTHFIITYEYPEKFKTHSELVELIIYFYRMRRQRYGIMSMDEIAIRDIHREKEIETLLRVALENELFEMYYQPICSLDNHQFVTAEALIRLPNSNIGSVGPDEFIPIAEKTGMIVQVGNYILEHVCRFIESHDLEKLGVEYIEINLSAIQCLQRNFIETLESILTKYNINPSQICFEITETASNCAPEIFSANLQYLHDTGYKLAIDDFGTGYANLQRMISIDFDILKFDKTMTFQISNDDKIKPVFAKMVTMLHSMDVKIVAEGIERQEQVDFFEAIGTDYIQGYIFSKALPAEEYMQFLLENQK